MTAVDLRAGAVASTQLDPENPWPGLESYDESSYGYFSGRTAEAAELLRRILDEPVTVLFGKSGLGKTSLLRAGVFPQLREKGILPILVRLQVRAGIEPLIHQVRHGLVEELRARNIEHPPLRDDESLWEYLHRSGREFWTPQNRLVRPVFVFDQFEELFTLGSAAPAAVQAFREDLADLAENRLPAALATRLEEHHAGRLDLDLQAMPYSIVVALREDFLADLEGWRLTMPSLRRNRMRLLPMGADQALQAVCNPRTAHLVPETLGRRIVAFLSSGTRVDDETPMTDPVGPTVEPALLSLFCRGVNEHRKRANKAMFDDALLEGGKDTIVSDFYKSSLADQPERVRRFVEEDLVTEHGFRNSYSVEDAIGRNAVTAAELDALINRHLLRHEHHLGADRVELTHDILTSAVVQGRDARRRSETSHRERRKRWRRVGGGAILAALLIVPVLVWLTIRAQHLQTQAEAAGRLATIESTRAKSRELAAIARETTDTDPELAMAVALEGLNGEGTAEARSALLEASNYVWPSTTLGVKELKGTPRAISLSGDGNRIAVLADDTITLWDVTTRPTRRVWQTDVVLSGGRSLAFSPDQKLIAVGRAEAITLLAAEDGRVDWELPQDEPHDRLIAFSPDGGWLAWAKSDEEISVLDLSQRELGPDVVKTRGFIGFALHQGGRAITTVGSPGLVATVLRQNARGNWTPTVFDTSTCMRPQSVSPGGLYLSATWVAKRCAYRIGPDDSSSIVLGSAGNTNDIIWSTRGVAYVDVLESRDLVVGRLNGRQQLEDRIRGGHRIQQLNDMTRTVSVADSGTRLAYVDSDEHKLVKIVSLGRYKPFLTGTPTDQFDVSPDGTWFAVGGAGMTADSGVVDIVSIDLQFPENHLPVVGAQITLEGMPHRLWTSADSVIVQPRTDPRTTTVYDRATGRARRAAYSGTVEPIGERASLLLLHDPAEGTWKIVKTTDGTEVAAGDGVRHTAVSRSRTALALLSSATPYGIMRTDIYTIGEATVTKVGDMALSDWSRLRPSDDGRWLVNTGARDEERRVHPVNAGKIDAPPTLVPPEEAQKSWSRTGRLELQVEPAQGEDQPTMVLVDREHGRTIKHFVGDLRHRFSADDKRLALWGAGGLQIIDLDNETTILSLRYPDVDDVRFIADNSILAVQRSDKNESETMLVPLGPEVMQRFARWLTPRVLKSEERCLYGLSGDHCR